MSTSIACAWCGRAAWDVADAAKHGAVCAQSPVRAKVRVDTLLEVADLAEIRAFSGMAAEELAALADTASVRPAFGATSALVDFAQQLRILAAVELERANG